MTARKSCLLVCACLSFTQMILGQKNVVISGIFPTEDSTASLSVFKPVNGFFNIFYPNANDETVIKNSRFSMVLILDHAGFVRLQSKAMPKTYFYASPGDSIQIVFTAGKSGEITTTYSGSNAGANNLLTSKTLLNDGPKSEEVIFSIFKKAKTANEAYISLDQEVKSCIIPLQDLYNEKRITKSCFEAILSETQQKMLAWTNGLISGYLNNNENVKSLISLSKNEIMALIQKLNMEYDPFNIRNRVATTNYNNCHNKSKFILNNIIPEDKKPISLWAQYDTLFGMVLDQFAAIDCSPDDVQMYLVGNSLLTASVFKPMSEADYMRVYKTYCQKFPASPYIPILSNYISEIKSKKDQKTEFAKFGIYFKDANSDKLIEQSFTGIDTITTIQSFVREYFKGSPVFIDFWATWCSPCIAEFGYEPELHNFLEKNNIKIIYVSIDTRESAGNWKNLVEKYRLTGYHYLANPKVKDNLSKWFQGIPRYMLFDSEGLILNDNLLRPSKKEELHNQITNAFKK